MASDARCLFIYGRLLRKVLVGRRVTLRPSMRLNRWNSWKKVATEGMGVEKVAFHRMKSGRVGMQEFLINIWYSIKYLGIVVTKICPNFVILFCKKLGGFMWTYLLLSKILRNLNGNVQNRILSWWAIPFHMERSENSMPKGSKDARHTFEIVYNVKSHGLSET